MSDTIQRTAPLPLLQPDDIRRIESGEWPARPLIEAECLQRGIAWPFRTSGGTRVLVTVQGVERQEEEPMGMSWERPARPQVSARRERWADERFREACGWALAILIVGGLSMIAGRMIG